MLDACKSKEFASLPPSRIVPELADQGRYLASESSIYRILRASCTGFRATRPDQAARISVSFAATPPIDVASRVTKGNWFAPFRRRHVFAAA